MSNLIQYSQTLLQEMKRKIEELWQGKEGKPSCPEISNAIKIAHDHYRLLKTELNKYGAKPQNQNLNEGEEIIFYKEIIPAFLSRLLYFNAIFQILTKWPTGTLKAQHEFLENEINKIESYFLDNKFFYTWYRNGFPGLETFILGKTGQEDRLAFGHLFIESLEEDLAMGFASKLAQVMANDEIQIFLEREMAKISQTNLPVPAKPTPPQKLGWTGSKASLVELAYALHFSGAINNGQASIKEIVGLVENSFGISLGNYYNTYMEIKMRKKEYAPFLAMLKNVFEKKITDSFNS